MLLLRHLLAAVLLCAFQLSAQAQGTLELKDMDAVRISLLTCQPHEEVYSIYGHTAIRYQDVARGTDLAVNYGMFSFHKPYFVLRFVFGLTDYEMGIETLSVHNTPRTEVACTSRCLTSRPKRN